MKKMKQISALLLILIMVVSTATVGCSKGSQEKETTKDGKVVISVWAWDVALMQLQDAAKEFQKTHENVEFEFEEMGTEQIYNKLSTSLATGNGIADVIAIEGEVLAGYADKFPEGFLDLSDAVNKEEFLPVKIGEVEFNDKIHAFPWDAGPMGMFYRKDYFEQAGVKAEDIITWDDFIEAGKKVTANCKTPNGDPVKMLPIRPTKPSIYSTIRSELGKATFDDEGNTIVNSKESIQAMELTKKIYDAGIALDYNGWDEYEGTVVNQSVATIPEAVWMIGTIKDKAPDTSGKWGVIDLPKVTADGSSSCANGGSVLAINAKAADPDLTTEFVKFAMTDEQLQANGFEKYGLYPSYIPSYENEIFTKGDEFFGGDNIYEVFIENGKKIPQFVMSENNAEANDAIGVAVSKILLNGEDVNKTMNELQDELVTKFGK
ncbi:ABC transporter substrate-binding protein [Lachnospiraceae bacterium LCP25S3_G4]